MDDIILRISRHYITGLTGIFGLGIATYFIRRYLSNTEKTTNAYYTRSDELETNFNLPSLIHSSARKIYLFWNASFNSTYLLVDYLQQDYIVQPLYIERYTIRKTLEHELLEKYTDEYNNSRTNNVKCDTIILEYLAEVAKMKRKQDNEISQITTLRRVITNQYPEFRYNLLPTRYITTIEKDLTHSQQIYDVLRELNLPPLEYVGIEFFEQSSRYLKHIPSNPSKPSNPSNLRNTPEYIEKVVFGYSKDSYLTPIIQNIMKKIQIKNQMQNATRNNIDLPLAGITNNTIKYLASQKINKEVIRFLSS